MRAGQVSKIRQIMTSSGLLTVREEDDLGLAAQMMSWAGIRHLPVVRGRDVVGVLSERDVLLVRAEDGPEAERALVGEAMTSPAKVARPDDDVRAVAARMARERLGCLPVVDDGRLVGIITRSDVLAHLQGASLPRRPEADATVDTVMRRDVSTVHGDDDLMNAAARLLRREVRHLPVIDGDGRVIGMLTDRDVRTAIGDPRRAIEDEALSMRVQSLRVWSAMSTPVITVHPDAPLEMAIGYFIDRRLGALPVVDDRGRLVGILSYVDVLQAIFPRSAREAHTEATAAPPT